MAAIARFLLWPVTAGLLAAALILAFNPGLYQTAATPTPHRLQDGFADTVEASAPAVVNVYSRRVVRSSANTPTAEPTADTHERIQQSLGSGVIVRSDGYLLTNNHVVAQATDILVVLHDGRELRADIIGSDEDTDLAVLKITAAGLTAMPFADPEQSRVGDIVLAIGNPWGFGHSVSQGIISATGRYGVQLQRFENFIQTDAAINPGNSGGALVNTRGELLGINTAIQSRTGGFEGIGLATPADTARRVMEDIIAHGRVLRAWMGVQVQDMTPALAQALGAPSPQGLLVNRVAPNSPAEAAGIRTGDILISAQDLLIHDGRQTMLDIAWRHPGDIVAFTLWREGAVLPARVELGLEPSH
ncbi:MAG TPA: trypsin-like peptidase domain-containing protein [Pseudomonadales bacterium]|jgi:serine protease DegS